MAGSYNKIILIGNLGRDPEARTTPTGDNVASFSLATSERRRGQDGQQQEQTTWFNISVWGQLADVATQYLHKGSYVYVEGSLTQREYTTREGATRFSLDVRARELRMLDKRGDQADQGNGSSQQAQDQGVRNAWTESQPNAPASGSMDDIPF